MMIEEDTPRGLDVWLTLLCIGLVVTPIWILDESRSYSSLFTDSTWAERTTPGGEAYSPHYKSLMIGSACGQFVRLLFSVILLILFFRERYLFPRAFIAFRIFDFFYHLLDAWLASLVFGVPMFDEPSWGEDGLVLGHTTLQLLLTGIPSAIWIPYMLKSRRVKLTFVRGKSGTG